MKRMVRPETLLAIASFGLLFSIGCASSIRLREIEDSEWFQRENRNSLSSSKPSERTLQFLRREGELERWEDDPLELFLDLHGLLMEHHDRGVAFHLAELCYREAERRDEQEQIRLYMSSVQYAYAYLFDEQLGEKPSAYDPTFRWVCDFYNRSLARVIERLQRENSTRERRETVKLPLLQGEVEVSLGVNEHAFAPSEFERILVGFNYETVGLPGAARSYGLGVPLILVRPSLDEGMVFKPMSLEGGNVEGSESEGEDSPEVEIQQSYPSTAILRFDGSVVGEETGFRRASLELYDPSRTASIELGGETVPLEAEITSALAYTLAQYTDYSGLRALFNVEEYTGQIGLLMFQPYDPEKIPVVFVHGLMSSPMTWMTLFNDLLADPELRHRYQFWFFRYPTGNPILYSSSLLRETLRQIEANVDPNRENPAFQSMVICGHSMGGLLTKFQILDGGERAWSLLSDRPLSEMGLSEDQEELLRRVIYFERLPFIRRTVFLATPHRGADLATSWIGKLGSSLVDLPKTIYEGSLRLGNLASTRFRERFGELSVNERTTGIAGLRRDSLIATDMSDWPLPEGLPIHSIIGNEDQEDTPGGSDGVVHYESSHLDGVDSEKIVESGHNVQENSIAIRELRRILHLHLKAYDGIR